MSVKKLSIVLLDFFENKILNKIRSGIETALNVHTTVTGWESITELCRSEFRSGSRYRSTELINYFSDNLGKEFEKVLFLTTDDLYSPVFNKYFGEAQLNGRIGIVSTFFLSDNLNAKLGSEVIFMSRFEKEVIHEAGHLFGLKHCNDINCVMKLSGKPADIDIKSPVFCATCTEVLINSTLSD